MGATGDIAVLRKHGVTFTEHGYRYEERGGTAVSSRELGVDEHAVIKTLIMEDDAKRPMIVTAEGGRVDGAGKLAYLANGHDMRAFENPAMKQLWANTIEWCLKK